MKKYPCSRSWGHASPVLRTAHQRRGLLQSLLQPQRPARGAAALCAALLQRPHQVRGWMGRTRTSRAQHVFPDYSGVFTVCPVSGHQCHLSAVLFFKSRSVVTERWVMYLLRIFFLDIVLSYYNVVH